MSNTELIKFNMKISKQLNEKITKYSISKNITKSQAARMILEDFFNNEKEESEILKEIKLLRAEVRDNHNFIKKNFDRVAKLLVKNGIKIFAAFQAILILGFLRAKDKGFEDQKALNSKIEIEQTSLKLATEEYNKR